MNPLLQAIAYVAGFSFFLSGVFLMLVAFDIYEIDERTEAETNWPAMFCGLWLAVVGAAIFAAVRPV